MIDYKVEVVKLPARSCGSSLIGVGGNAPFGWGNYFYLRGYARVVNMWLENMEALVQSRDLHDGTIEGVLYEHHHNKWFLVTDARAPADYLYNRLCFTGYSRPPLEIAEDMFDRLGGDIYGALEEWTDPVSYWEKKGGSYDPESGIITLNVNRKPAPKIEITHEVVQELNAQHGIDAIQELTTILAKEIQKQED